jgi:RimJ/RimL family protein N-acetyltransferase
VTETVRSARLDLISLAPAFLEAALAGDSPEASRILGARVPDDWPGLLDTQQVFLEHLRADPALARWSMRAIVLRAESRMLGQIGCHGAPTPDGVELAFSVFPGNRRRGYAREACSAFMGWARLEHAVERFVVSIDPANTASLALARSLGFRQVGEQTFERRVERA